MEKQLEAIEIVAGKLPANKLGITKEHLQAKENLGGEGVFVYVPETNFFGVTRCFCWIVVDGVPYSINGSTFGTLTPNLPCYTRVESLWVGKEKPNVIEMVAAIFFINETSGNLEEIDGK